MRKCNSFLQSMLYALSGIKTAIQQEKNIRIDMICTGIALVSGALFRLSRWEWIVVLLLIGIVWMGELINTAIENLADSVTEEFNPRIKVAKDVAAGAVLVFCIIAIVVAILIYFPHLVALCR